MTAPFQAIGLDSALVTQGERPPEAFATPDNIDKDELRALQEVAKDLLGFDDRQLGIALQAGEIVEVRDGDDKA